MKSILFASLLFVSGFLMAGPEVETGSATDATHFQGRVTAVNSNANRPGLSFTAVDSQGHIKMFYISTLENLEINDRVELTCKGSDKFPIEVVRIRFLSPK
jgi:hypothetical protein